VVSAPGARTISVEQRPWWATRSETQPSALKPCKPRLPQEIGVPETLGLVSTILGAAKDALARKYVSLATNTHAPSLDMQALFAGTEGHTRT
jgi:hypothetical protein